MLQKLYAKLKSTLPYSVVTSKEIIQETLKKYIIVLHLLKTKQNEMKMSLLKCFVIQVSEELIILKPAIRPGLWGLEGQED